MIYNRFAGLYQTSLLLPRNPTFNPTIYYRPYPFLPSLSFGWPLSTGEHKAMMTPRSSANQLIKPTIWLRSFLPPTIRRTNPDAEYEHQLSISELVSPSLSFSISLSVSLSMRVGDYVTVSSYRFIVYSGPLQPQY